jgi:hypothetical protein
VSYNFNIKVDANGQVTCPGGAQYAPEGSFTLSGHVDADGKNETVTVQRHSIAGDVVAQASSYHR